MTIDEAIKHCEEVAENQEWLAEQDMGDYSCKLSRECASEHRQLADWLRELEALKKGIGEMWELLREPPRYVPNLDAYNRCLELVFKYVDNKDEVVMEVKADE